MKLLNELLAHQLKRQLSEAAHDHALIIALAQDGAQYLKNAGKPVTIENIAEIMNISASDIEAAQQWSQGKKRAKHAMPELNPAGSAARSDYDKLLLAIKWHDRRSGRGRISDKDRAVMGLVKVRELTGMSRVEFLELANQYLDDIKTRFPNFKMAWLEHIPAETREKNAKNRHPETRKNLIRQAILDLSGGKLYTVTADMIERWVAPDGYRIGITANQVNRILSNDPDMADLNKYRVRGRTTTMPTDADREMAYQRAVRPT